MQTFGDDDYNNNLNYLIPDEPLYNYYIIFADGDDHPHIQIQYKSPRTLALRRMTNFRIENDTITYNDLKKLIDDGKIHDVQIENSVKYLILRRGPFGNDIIVNNYHLLYYCFKQNINPFYNE